MDHKNLWQINSLVTVFWGEMGGYFIVKFAIVSYFVSSLHTHFQFFVVRVGLDPRGFIGTKCCNGI